MNIYVEDNSKNMQDESFQKNYRNDVYVKIDNKWSCYSENYFAGKRIASTTLGDIQLKPTIELNLGAQYTINNWLNVYVQLNNFLNRKNDIFYGYQAQGCHFIGGVKYKF